MAPVLPCPADQVDEFIAQPTPGAIAALERAAGPFLILGAGGKMGLHVALMVDSALRAAGRKEKVLAVSRFQTLRAREEFESRGVTALPCDLEDPAALERLPDAGTVFFLAGVKFGTKTAPDLLRRLNLEMPRKVAERFRAARIVAFSSGAVYPFVTPASGGATEGTPPAPVGDYAASCLGREQSFAEASRRHGTPVVLIRLNYAVEFRYGVLVDIAQKVMREEPLDVGMGYLNAIWQGDAVAHAIQALAVAASPPAPLNVTGTEPLSIRDLAGRFGQIMGRTPKIIGEEAPTALLSNAAQSHQLFGPPRVPLDEVIGWTAAWLAQGGTTWGKPTGFERRDGRY